MREKPARSVLLRYTLFQVPSLFLLGAVLYLLHRWIDLAAWISWGILACWIVKDALLFPFLWRSYRPGSPGAADSMVGLAGTARGPLAPVGKVEVRGEIWHAELSPGSPHLDAGAEVRISAMKGLKLIVEPGGAKGAAAGGATVRETP
jgi:membrane protein implicated in regulation of membrane protease activity